MVISVEDFNTPGFFTHFVRKNITNSAQFEHGGGSPLVQVTHDAGGTLSNEEHFLREASLCREIFTVVWRYWITLVVWFGWCCGLMPTLLFLFASFLEILGMEKGGC